MVHSHSPQVRAAVLAGILGLLVSLPAPLRADDVSCSDSQVQKCFVDGTTTNCLCLAPAEGVEPNPPAEDDGHINPDE